MAPLVILFLSPCAVLLPALSIIFWHKKDCGLASRHRVYYVWTGSWNKAESISYQTTLLCIWVETTMTFEHFWLIKKVSDCKTETEINFGLVIMTFFFEMQTDKSWNTECDWVWFTKWFPARTMLSGKVASCFFFFWRGVGRKQHCSKYKRDQSGLRGYRAPPFFLSYKKNTAAVEINHNVRYQPLETLQERELS